MIIDSEGKEITPRPYKISILTDDKDSMIKSIKDFLQGCIYCWCACNHGKEFSTRDFLGETNRDWSGTPTFQLFQAYVKNNTMDIAIKKAGQDVGRILRQVLESDSRKFRIGKGPRILVYWWIP